MGIENDSIPYEIRIKNFLYELQQKPYQLPTEEDLCAITEEEFTINRLYAEAVKPVIELIHTGKIEAAKEIYSLVAVIDSMEPVKEKVKNKKMQ